LQKQKDNSTFREKIALRRRMLQEVARPVVLETHGGAGKVYRAVYGDAIRGVVFEKDSRKAELLAAQRPTWAVYEADCVRALSGGVASELTPTVLDVDPYGEPWPVLSAFFESERIFADVLHVVVNDGLRQRLKVNQGWNTESMHEVVQRFGNDLYPHYLEVCRWLIAQKAATAGYTVAAFEGYYCGYLGQMTHYRARLEQR
jgi:hypothetical protein